MGAKKILVVDFDQEFLKFLSRFLRNQGFTVVTATDGSAGLELYKSTAPDLVITEAMLPKLHGFELCSRISQSPTRKTPVIIVTGVYRDTVYKTEALRTFGASAYFEKPLDPDDLMISLKKILGLPDSKEPEAKAEDPIDTAIMEALVSETAAYPSPEIPAGKSSAEEVDNLLKSTLAEFGLKPGKKKAPVEILAPKPQVAGPAFAPDKPVSAPRTRPPAVAVPAAPPVWAPQAVVAPSDIKKPKPFEPIPSFGGYGENKKKGFPPRLFGAVAGVLVLTSATFFVLKPGKERVPAEKSVPPVVAEVRTEAVPLPPTTEPFSETAPVSQAENQEASKPAPAKENPRPAAPAVKNPLLPKPEDIEPLAPETTPNMEIQAPETAPSPVDTAPMAADSGAGTAETEAPVEIPAVKVRAGDLVSLGEADVPPRQVKTTDPVYPGTAMSMHREGSIMINVLISETGDVIQTAVIGGDRGSLGFDKAAENAVRKWKFSPAVKDGVPVRVWKPVTIGFKLKK